MSQSDSWSDHDDVADSAEAAQATAAIEQMKAATSSLRARLSIVRDLSEDGPGATG